MLGLICRKCGMSRLLDNNGNFTPVTIVQVLENLVTQVKTIEKDGYSAIQVAAEEQKERKTTKPLLGHFAKAKIKPHRVLMEFRVDEELAKNISLDINFYKENDLVDATGISKGKGFQGVIKRHNFSSQGNSHGVTKSHRGHGSIGNCQDPGRVLPGRKMAGHMGNERVTVQNLKVLSIDVEHRFMAVKGAIPGPSGGIVVIKQAVKGR